jgi:Phage tail tube protein
MLLGIMTAVWGSTELPLKTGNSVEIGGVVSKAVAVGATIDFANAMMPSVISLKVAVQQGVSVTGTYPSGVGKELQVTFDTGQNFVWANAFRQGTIKITDGDNSEATVEFGGGTPLEV